MTEDIGSDKHKRPSSAEIDIVKMRERYTAMAADVGEIKAMLRDIHGIQTDMASDLKVGTHRFGSLEAKLKEVDEDTSTRLTSLENDKRSPVAIVLGVLSGIGPAATAIWVGIKGSGGASP